MRFNPDDWKQKSHENLYKQDPILEVRNVEKEYFAEVDGAITFEAMEALKNGVEIGFGGIKYTTKPCNVYKLNEIPNLPERGKKLRDNRHGPTNWVSITLTEGKFRQVRKMTAAAGFPTLRLVRVRVGNLHINDMKAGEVKEILNFRF